MGGRSTVCGHTPCGAPAHRLDQRDVRVDGQMIPVVLQRSYGHYRDATFAGSPRHLGPRQLPELQGSVHTVCLLGPAWPSLLPRTHRSAPSARANRYRKDIAWRICVLRPAMVAYSSAACARPACPAPPDAKEAPEPVRRGRKEPTREPKATPAAAAHVALGLDHGARDRGVRGRSGRRTELQPLDCHLGAARATIRSIPSTTDSTAVP